ncbi:PH domain-containing protein [Streptomyces sp. TRM68416]|uniref:PH domain-containing protein n=1 Tax=Streptomyces sp. TRM68416 TaxID=2758412 RepID=UPI001662060C|nr:PH domain-containing protein [Streptomyces sp. TRM68416]MBD0839325.1 PH domain-containing protein [Streptomyces sp. TRM68416]
MREVVRDVVCRISIRRTLWCLVVLGAAGAVTAVVSLVYAGAGPWPFVGACLAVAGLVALRALVVEVRADAYGVHSRTLLRRRSTPWYDIAELRVRMVHENNPKVQPARRLELVPREGRRRVLPLPYGHSGNDRVFDAEVAAFRALHRRYGTPSSDHLVVVSRRTAGRGWAGALSACVVLLGFAVGFALATPGAAGEERAWRAATACTDATPDAERAECVSSWPAVITRTEPADRPKQPSYVYFQEGAEGGDQRLSVTEEAARSFQPGDEVELSVWRRTVMTVSGEHHVWHRHVVTGGSTAVVATLFALAAGFPAARLLVRVRCRRLPADDVLPSTLPFAGVLFVTGLWLVPLSYRHPTSLPDTPAAITWAAVGTLVTVGLFAWAWRATRVRTPAVADVPEGQEEVFLSARFLEATDYNPHQFGTHIALGGGEPPAVTPGPGRFGARVIPVGRLTLRQVRRARGGDGDLVPASWHIAEFDDAGTVVRLAAAPADLNRVLRALGAVETLEDASTPGADR